MRPTDDLVLGPCRGAAEWPVLVAIWRGAVQATHQFLTPDGIDYYEKRLAGEYLGLVELTVATLDGTPVGFSGLAEGKLEMLFIDQRHRGHGVGSALLREAIAKAPGLLVDVNEQRPFPILHLGLGRPPTVGS